MTIEEYYRCPECLAGDMRPSSEESFVFDTYPPMEAFTCDKCGHIEEMSYFEDMVEAGLLPTQMKNEPADKQLTDEFLNKFIHEKVMGECWHRAKSAPVKWGYDSVARCSKCGNDPLWIPSDNDYERPNYCNSLDTVSKAEAKVIKEKWRDYDLAINQVVREYPLGLVSLITATARQRAEAIYKLEAEKDEN